jgi:hypothetical protein
MATSILVASLFSAVIQNAIVNKEFLIFIGLFQTAKNNEFLIFDGQEKTIK